MVISASVATALSTIVAYFTAHLRVVPRAIVLFLEMFLEFD